MKFTCASVFIVAAAQASAQTCDEWAYLDPAPPVVARTCAFDHSRQGILALALPLNSTFIPSQANAPLVQNFTIEDGVWTVVSSGPDLRTGIDLQSATAMAFDVDRGRMVAGGGWTYELVNGVWVRASTDFAARLMTFDSTRGKIIGTGSDASLREWDGSVWTEIPTAGQLSYTTNASILLHDPSRDETWVFATNSTYTVRSAGAWGPRITAPWSGSPLVAYVDPDDLSIHAITHTADHRWDGSVWTSSPLSGWPSGFTSASRAAAWDPVRREAVVINVATNLVPGAPRAAVLRDRVWNTYSTLGLTPQSADDGLVYDSARERLIGNDPTGTVEIIGSEIRTLDPRNVRPLAYDPSRDVVLGVASVVAYVFTNNHWEPAPAGGGLSVDSSATYDVARGRIVGVRSRSSNLEVFSFADGEWSIEGASSSSALGGWDRSWITFDPVRQQSLLTFSALGLSSLRPTRIESGGQIPTLIAEAQVSHYGVTTVYDPNRGGLVATGGRYAVDGSLFPLTTFLLRSDGLQWEQIAPLLPAGRKYFGAAYDTVRERVVIWGGMPVSGSGTTPMYLGFGPAAIVRQPAPLTASAGSIATLRVIAKGGGHLQYRWQKDGIDIHDTALRRGTARDVLTITNVGPADIGRYSVRVFNPCGEETSVEVSLRLCQADLNFDGGVDGDDIILFFAAWDAGQQDFDGDGDTDGDDVIAFFFQWDSGCTLP